MVSFLKKIIGFFLDKELWVSILIELSGIMLFCFITSYLLFFTNMLGVYKLILWVFSGVGLYVLCSFIKHKILKKPLFTIFTNLVAEIVFWVNLIAFIVLIVFLPFPKYVNVIIAIVVLFFGIKLLVWLCDEEKVKKLLSTWRKS
jgi:hypothetical protein